MPFTKDIWARREARPLVDIGPDTMSKEAAIRKLNWIYFTRWSGFTVMHAIVFVSTYIHLGLALLRLSFFREQGPVASWVSARFRTGRRQEKESAIAHHSLHASQHVHNNSHVSLHVCFAFPSPFPHTHMHAQFVCPFYFSWTNLAKGMLIWFFTGCLGICMCFHRQLTHRSFKTPKWLGKSGYTDKDYQSVTQPSEGSPSAETATNHTCFKLQCWRCCPLLSPGVGGMDD